MISLKKKVKQSISYKPNPRLNTSNSSKKNSTNSIIPLKTDYNSTTELKKELEDPNNEHLKDSIASIMKINYDINVLSKTYDRIKEAKTKEEAQIKSLAKEISFNTLYEYTSYLKGLNSIVASFLSSSVKQIKKIKATGAMTPAAPKQTKEKIESLYQVLGHDNYSSLLSLYEKYCEYGKTITNFNLDYSQFCMMLTDNNLYLLQQALSKEKCEVIYNRVKQANKGITFESFIDILSEMCKTVIQNEPNWLNRLKYYYSAYISKAPCLKKTMFAKELDRYYFMLENKEITDEIERMLPLLYKEYLNNVIGDMRYGEVMDSVCLVGLCKKKQVIPVFMSSKEVIEILNFVKYKTKRLLPSNFFDFLVFCEVICLISFYSYGKYYREESKKKFTNNDNENCKTYFSQVEQIRLFIKFILEKA